MNTVNDDGSLTNFNFHTTVRDAKTGKAVGHNHYVMECRKGPDGTALRFIEQPPKSGLWFYENNQKLTPEEIQQYGLKMPAEAPKAKDEGKTKTPKEST